jgi:hypothetical protein
MVWHRLVSKQSLPAEVVITCLAEDKDCTVKML